MKFRTLLITVAAFLCGAAMTFAQTASDPLKPRWLHSLPTPTNSTFIYKTVTASSFSLDDARKQTVVELIDDAGMKGGVAIVSDHTSHERVSQIWENGKLTEKISNNLETNTYAKSSEMVLHASLIDEYWMRDVVGNYHVTRLYAKSELGRMPLYDNTDLTTSYASDPTTWGLSLIPGAAQMHKGSYLKGGIIMGGSVALLGGMMAFESLRSSYRTKINQTHSADVKKTYNNKAGNCATARNLCIGGFAALYVYNILDAFIAPGARRVIVTPSATLEGQYGMAVTYSF